MSVKNDYDEDDGNNDETESRVFCKTSAGDFVMKLNRSWSPKGYDRAVELFERGYYDHSHFFRVVPNFLVQFGIGYTYDQDLKAFANSRIKDDPQLEPPIPFDEGVISFAGSGPNSRTSHLFIAYGPVKSLGTQLWETPIGVVIEGMETIRNLNSEYGDMPPWGHGPEQQKIRQGGKAYIEQEFPNLDSFIHCRVERGYEKEGTNERADDDYQQENGGEVKKGVGSSSSFSSSSSIHTKDDKKQQLAESRTGSTGHIFLPFFAAITAFLIVVYLTRRKKKVINKNF